MSGDGRKGAPARRDRTRPIELVVLSAIFGAFTGLVVGFATREWILAAEFFGVIFIVSLVVLAMIMLGQAPPDDPAARVDAAASDDEPRGH